MAKRFKPIRSNSYARVPVIFRDRPFDVQVTPLKGNYSKRDFLTRVGQWLDFTTPWGNHRGVIEDVKSDSVLVKMPKNSIPSGWANDVKSTSSDIKLISLVGYDNCQPHNCHPQGWTRGPWCWVWIPIVVVIFIFPWFCW